MAKFDALTSLIISLIGNFSLSGVFLNVLLHPSKNAHFIANAGFFILFIEFLTICYSLLLIKFAPGINVKKIFVFLFFLIFVLGIFSLSKDAFIVLFFLVSLVTKLFGRNAILNMSFATAVILSLLLSGLMAGMLSSLINSMFPFPEELLTQKPDSQSPQTLMVWGLIYFFLTGIMEIVFFIKKAKTTNS